MLKITSDFKVSKTTFDIFRSGAEMSLTKSNYVLLDEKAQEEALKAQSSQDGCLDDSCLIDTGRMLAAKILFVVSIKKAGKFYLFNAKVINLETSTTEKSFSVLYEHSLDSVKKLFAFSKELTKSTLTIKPTKKKEVNIFFSKEMSYLTPYFKLGVLAYDFGEEDYVKFLYSGLGISLIEYNGSLFNPSLNLDLSYNLADSYLVTDLNSRFLFSIINGLNLGVELGLYIANGELRPRGGFASEYRLKFTNNLFLKFNLNIGVMNYDIPIKDDELSSIAVYTDFSTSIGWDF